MNLHFRKESKDMYEEFKNLLIEQMNIDADDIKPEAELVADLGINSIELADLIFSCEDKFSVTIEEEAYKTFVTVNDVVSYLEAHAEN